MKAANMRNISRSLLASTALCATLASAALAADLPSRKAPPPVVPIVVPPVFTWTGFYLGANIGGIWTRDRVRDLYPNDYGAIPGNANTLNLSGVVGGVQAGYNYQFSNSNIVVGLEAEFEGASANGKFSYAGFRAPPPLAVHSANMPYFGDLRARVGVAFDRWLPFVTGGVVFASLKNSLVDSTFPFSLNRGGSATGWALGGGVEYALDMHWSVKAEYLFMQFPDVTRSFMSGFAWRLSAPWR